MQSRKRIVIAALVLVPAALLGLSRLSAAPASDGEQVIEATARAYQNASAFSDTIDIQLSQPGGEAEDSISLAFDKGSTRLRMHGYLFISRQGTLVAQKEDLPTKYVQMAQEGSLIETLLTATGGQAAVPAPQLLLRAGESMDAYVNAFGLGLAGNVRLVGHDSTTENGVTVNALSFEADDNVAIRAHVDARTNFIRMIEMKRDPFTYTFTMSPQGHDRLPEPIAFDPSGRRKVDDLSQLSRGEGDPAPDFTLETLDGTQVALSELRGSVVVLDFWATWCGPCKRALPKLKEFSDWAEQNRHPVRVYAVNMGERQPGPAQRRATVEKFWKSFWKSPESAMPMLMDYDDTVARSFDVGPIPHTVVIGPDGTIVKVKVGYDESMVKTLQEVALKAMKSSG